MKRTLLFFDFDHTIIDYNSDEYFVDKLKPDWKSYMMQLYSTKQHTWLQLIQHMLNKFLTEGNTTSQQLEDCIKQIPLHPHMLQIFHQINVLQKQHPQSIDVYIASDANTWFIQTILRANHLEHLIHRIYTNSCVFDQQTNQFLLSPYHGSTQIPSHSCSICPTNLCKGTIFLSEATLHKYERLVVIGDGSNDFCPCAKMKNFSDKECYALVRHGYRLSKLLQTKEEPYTLSSHVQVMYWNNYEELQQLFSNLLQEE